MTDDIVDAVRADAGTELDRLGSEKALIAATDATLESAAVLGSVADTVATGHAVLASWAAEVEDATVADSLSAAAGRFETGLDALGSHLDRDPATDASIRDALDGHADAVARAGAGMVGLPLVLDRMLLQAVSFFVNEADAELADLFRDLREVCDETLDRGTALLSDREPGERDQAVDAAVAVVTAAYEEYVASLEAMGLDPKPIC